MAKPERDKAKQRARDKEPKAGKLPDGLAANVRQFAKEYLANGFNGTKAYQTVHPKAAYGTAATEACRTLKNPKVRQFLNPLIEEHWRVLQMGGEQALGRIALDASVDIRRLYGENGRLLKPQDWPDDIAGSIKAVQHGEDGEVNKVTLVDPLAARRLVLDL